MNLEEYYNNIYRYCYLHTQNRHTAEDLTQETFLKFLETSNYQDRGKPLAFLYTIARNLCIDHIRQNSKSSDACRRAAESFIPAAEDTELAATSVALSQAVKELSETDREIICLRYVLEMNPGEIGRIMDLSRFSPWQLSRKPDIRHAAAWKSWNFPHGFPCMRSFVQGSASWERKTCSCWESCCYPCVSDPGHSRSRSRTQEIYQTIGGINMELHIDRLSKHYKNKIAVDRISLTLQKGVHGLLGANGAGKTTLMRMICGILRPDSGTVTFGRTDVSTESCRGILGYLPQDFGYYPGFTAEDFLMYMAALKGLRRQDARCRTKELLSLVGLNGHEKEKIKTYSGGMKQRLGIAQALLNRPKLLVLDEPTAGLDPKERVRFREMIDQLGQESIVLLSTHIVSDIEMIADRILIMKDGCLIFNGTREDIGDNLEEFYLEQFDDAPSGSIAKQGGV